MNKKDLKDSTACLLVVCSCTYSDIYPKCLETWLVPAVTLTALEMLVSPSFSKILYRSVREEASPRTQWEGEFLYFVCLSLKNTLFFKLWIFLFGECSLKLPLHNLLKTLREVSSSRSRSKLLLQESAKIFVKKHLKITWELWSQLSINLYKFNYKFTCNSQWQLKLFFF